MAKSSSARQIVTQMQMEGQPLDLGHVIETVYYRGYAIKVYPKLCESRPQSCIIGYADNGLAHRSGMEEAERFIDELFPKSKSKSRFKVRRVRSAYVDCPACDGSGASASGKNCRSCLGTGVKK